MNKQDHDRLVDIQRDMLDLLNEAKRLIRYSGNKFENDRAVAYWLAHVEMGLTNEHSFLGNAGCSMDDTIRALDPGEEPEDEDSDDCLEQDGCGA